VGEEDSTEEEERIYVIIVTNRLGIWHEIVRILVQCAHIVDN